MEEKIEWWKGLGEKLQADIEVLIRQKLDLNFYNKLLIYSNEEN